MDGSCFSLLTFDTFYPGSLRSSMGEVIHSVVVLSLFLCVGMRFVLRRLILFLFFVLLFLFLAVIHLSFPAMFFKC